MNRIKYLIYRIKYRFLFLGKFGKKKIWHWNRVFSREERAALMDEMNRRYGVI